MPTTDNIIGDLDQLLLDAKSWPNGTINWSEKAKMYKIRTKAQDLTPPNGGQMVKAYLERNGVDVACLEGTVIVNKSDFQNNGIVN